MAEQSPTLDTVKPPAVLQIKGNSIARDTAQKWRTWCYPDENGTYTLNATDVDGVLCMTDTQPNTMISDEICGSLSATMYKDPPCTVKIRSGSPGGGKGALVQTDISGTISASQDQTLFEYRASAANQRGEVRFQNGDGDVNGAILSSNSGKQINGVIDGYAVRRLTPRECERLQGFPDDWTLVPYKGKPYEACPDTPRYKAIGNSMAVPVMRWLGQRIEMVEGRK